MIDSFIIESGPSKEYKLAPVGLHLGRCYGIVDLGTQTSTYDDKVKHLRKIMVSWELHGEDDEGNPLAMEDGAPMSVNKTYTMSFAERATLRLDMESWEGRKFSDDEARRFDLSKILNDWFMLNVVHRAGKNNRNYANVGSISPVPKALAKHGFPEPHNELRVFKLHEPNLQVFESLSIGVRRMILASPEGQSMAKRHNIAAIPAYEPKPSAPAKGKTGFDDMEDDIPF